MSENLTVLVLAVFMHSVIALSCVFVHLRHRCNLHPTGFHTISSKLFSRRIGAPYPCILVVVDGVDGTPHKQLLGYKVAVGQSIDFLFSPSTGQSGAPSEVTNGDVATVDGKLNALVACLGDIFPA